MKFNSVTGKKWTLKKFNQEDINFLKKNFFLDEITSKLLSIRRVKKEDINIFLNPSIKNVLPDPKILKDMEKAVKKTADIIISGNKKIGIFGDYDVDGASSTAILGTYFNQLNQSFEIYIPDRKNEGYGPSVAGFNKLIETDVKLIFTVDCGTPSHEPINYAQKKNIDVIVLDHHQSDIKLPNAYSIVNPNRYDDNSNLNYLCASGVCFMFLVSLNKHLREVNWFKDNSLSEPNLINYLDLVSLGTVCDVVPLIGLNRAIVKQGLKIIKLKKNLGLKTLIDICKIENHPTVSDLGFKIGPRINAGGRVGRCSHGANLLLNINPKDTYKIASELDNFNKERQILEKELLDEIMKSTKINLKDPILILDGKNWHEGVIGIIASRLKEKFNKPSIIISFNNKNIGKASARSVLGFDIGSAIIAAVEKKILKKGGGHKMAGGFSIEYSNLNIFREFIIKKYTYQNQTIENQKICLLDAEISPSAINLDFFNKIDNLSPFGSGNPEPKFALEKLRTVNSKIVGENHIKSVLSAEDGSTIKTIAFNAVETELSYYLLNKSKNPFNIAGKISLNEWKGKKNVEFIIDDISVIKK